MKYRNTFVLISRCAMIKWLSIIFLLSRKAISFVFQSFKKFRQTKKANFVTAFWNLLKSFYRENRPDFMFYDIKSRDIQGRARIPFKHHPFLANLNEVIFLGTYRNISSIDPSKGESVSYLSFRKHLIRLHLTPFPPLPRPVMFMQWANIIKTGRGKGGGKGLKWRPIRCSSLNNEQMRRVPCSRFKPLLLEVFLAWEQHLIRLHLTPWLQALFQPTNFSRTYSELIIFKHCISHTKEMIEAYTSRSDKVYFILEWLRLSKSSLFDKFYQNLSILGR